MTPRQLLKTARREEDEATRLLDVAYIARQLAVTGETVRAWIRSGKLHATRTPTGRYRISPAAFQKIKTQDSQTSQA